MLILGGINYTVDNTQTNTPDSVKAKLYKIDDEDRSDAMTHSRTRVPGRRHLLLDREVKEWISNNKTASPHDMGVELEKVRLMKENNTNERIIDEHKRTKN